MGTVSVTLVRQVFDNRLAGSLRLARDIRAYRVQGPRRIRALTPSERAHLVEMAFIRMFLAWEDFLEESYIRYLRGGKTRRGRKAKPLVTVISLHRARRLIYGEGRRYADWCEPSRVVERARLHFKDGEPYATPIDSAALHLNRMRVIRNRIAHRSEIAARQFRDLLREFYGSGHRQQSPGAILLASPPPAALPASGGAAQPTLMDLCGSILLGVAAQIVP